MRATHDSSKEPDDDGANWKDHWVLLQQRFANAAPTMELPPLASSPLGQGAPTRVLHGPSAIVTTGKSNPIVYQFLGDRQFQSFLDCFLGDRLRTTVQAPKVTMFNGQVAEISDISRRPFVTDVTKVVGNDKVAYQPVIQIFWEGTRIQLTPTITPDGHRMKCRFMFASIDGCKAFQSPRYPDAKDVRIQHPVVSTATLECEIEIPTGQTLLIGGLFPQTVDVETEQSVLDRLLGRQPPTVGREQVTFISITPRTIVPGEPGR